MPFHVFLSQSLSLVTGGLSVWKLAKDVVIAGLATLCVLLVWRTRAYKDSKFNWYVGAVAAYALLHILLYAAFRHTSLSVAALAAVYNVRLFLLLIIGLSAALLFGKKLDLNRIIRLVLIVSTVVALIGLVQYFLPINTLSHFGYSEARGAKPSFLIDNKPNLPRVMATLREPNSLGAFLIVPILLLAYKFVESRRRLLIGGLLMLHVLVLLLTFSRSAWLGLFISGLLSVSVIHGKWLLMFARRHVIWLTLLVVFVTAGLFMLRGQYFVQNTLFHSDEHTVGQGSDQKHLSYTTEGIKAIAKQPQGHGPGTAGPVSVHTDKPFITEDYYVQLGYELGVAGLLLFLALCLAVFLQLKAVGTPEAKILYSAFIGYGVCNLLLHTWANEAVATQWWLLAGIMLGLKASPSAIMKKAKSKR